MSRRTLAELREEILDLLDDRWLSTSDVRRRLGVGGSQWNAIALTLERLVSDGEAELKPPDRRRARRPGGVRRYRRRQDAGDAGGEGGRMTRA
jgi:hypothetical protein